jgi:glycosyltransferase involved in cell wall biosynthesis
MPEIAKDAALFVDPYRVGDIANRLDELWNDETLQAELKKKGIARSAKFDWAQMSSEYSTLYPRVA